MVLKLSAELEAAITAQARAQGTAPEALALKILTKRFLPPPPLEPRDDWERELFAIGIDCGIVLSDEALRREYMYD